MGITLRDGFNALGALMMEAKRGRYRKEAVLLKGGGGEGQYWQKCRRTALWLEFCKTR